MPVPWASCPDCHAPMRGKTCSRCGYEIVPVDRAPEKPAVLCSCGSKLTSKRQCDKTGHYPGWMGNQPTACPFCRGALQWDGGCLRCFGRAQESQPWSFPGARYELRDKHWVLVAKGPRKACTLAENAACGRIVQALRLGQVDLDTALGMLDEALEAHGGIPFDAILEPGASG